MSLGRRIEKIVGSDTYDYYHNEAWQCNPPYLPKTPAGGRGGTK